jgi:hypothetical protein
MLLGHGDTLGTGSGHKPRIAFLQATKPCLGLLYGIQKEPYRI